MRWDAEPYCYVCKDDEACTARRPGARGRKRARREGSYACHEAPSMAGHTLVSFALELSVYACMCALSIVRSFAQKFSAVITPFTGLGRNEF